MNLAFSEAINNVLWQKFFEPFFALPDVRLRLIFATLRIIFGVHDLSSKITILIYQT
jgi:hypothetical protein